MWALLVAAVTPTPTRVYLHVHRLNSHMYHTGMSFQRGTERVRFDFRAFADNFETVGPQEGHTLYWGTAPYTLEEVRAYEQTLHKRYIFGVYDCRHHSNALAEWAVGRPVPVWGLKALVASEVIDAVSGENARTLGAGGLQGCDEGTP